MTKIYIAAYKEFGDYKTLKKVCDYLLQYINKEDVLFYVSTGESGDNTCMKYVRDNGYKYIDWIPQKRGKNRSEEKLKVIKGSNHTILVHNYDSLGINIAIRQASENIKGKIVIVYPKEDIIKVYKFGEKRPRIKKISELNC